MKVLVVESGERTVRLLKRWSDRGGFVADDGLSADVDDLFAHKAMNPIHGRSNVVR